MGMKFTNNATSSLASGINDSVTSLTVASGQGALFPTLSGSDYFYCTLANIAGTVEIIKVTARSTDTFTIVRGQDNTSAASWSAGDKVELRPTAATLAMFAQTDGYTMTGAIQQAKAAVASTAIDVSTANYFSKTISGSTTFTVSNVPATGTACSFILDITNAGSNVTWWSGVKWAGGTAPTLTTSGRDVLGFFTHDGGTTWSGLVLGKDVK